MKRFLIAAGFLAAAQPAQSHCYSVWRYPAPQRCGTIAHRPATVFTPPTTVFIPPTSAAPPPPKDDDEDMARQRAIDRLRVELSALQVGNR